MSLLSQWLEDRTNFNNALDRSSSVHGGSDSESSSEETYLRTLFQNQNQWKCTKYARTHENSPSRSDMTNYFATALHYRNHDTSQDWGWGDYYIGVRECYVYCSEAYTLSTTLWTDDAGTIFLNGSQIATSASCTNKTVSLPFKKGLNHVEITFNEGRGGDGGYITTNLFTQSWVKWGYACYKMI